MSDAPLIAVLRHLRTVLARAALPGAVWGKLRLVAALALGVAALGVGVLAPQLRPAEEMPQPPKLAEKTKRPPTEPPRPPVNGLRWNNVEPDNVLRFWDVRTGRSVGQMAGHFEGVSLLFFTPDGKRLVSGSDDTMLLTWDASGHRKDRAPATADLSARELETCWADLAAPEARRAHRAIGKLETAPRQAISFLGRRLRSVSLAVPPWIARLIADLDNDTFAVREAASAELKKLAGQAEPALRRLLDDPPSPEVHLRAARLLEKVEGAPFSPEYLRALRAVAVLEGIGSPEARQALEGLARREPDGPVAQQARAALERLNRLASGRD